MINLLDIRYVRLGTRNGDVADAFARELLGLELARKEAGASYYRSDNRDHTLVYFEGDPSDQTVGFELRTPDELEAAATELSDSGVEVRLGTPDECEQRRVKSFVANSLVRPLADKWFMSDEELAREKQLAHERVVAEQVGTGARAAGGTTPVALVVLAWAAVGIPLAWGVYRTLLSAARFFS